MNNKIQKCLNSFYMKNKIIRGFLSPFVFVALIAFYSYILILTLVDYINGKEIDISFKIEDKA